MKCHRTREHAHTPNSQSLADTDRLSQSLCIIHRETGQGARFVAVSAFPAFQPLRHSLLLQNHNCYNPLPQYIMSMVHPGRLQRRVCANQKQTVRFIYSPRLSFLLAQVEVTDKCRHKVVDQSLAPSEKAAISTMFSS